jgi:hypothetical protein
MTDVNNRESICLALTTQWLINLQRTRQSIKNNEQIDEEKNTTIIDPNYFDISTIETLTLHNYINNTITSEKQARFILEQASFIHNKTQSIQLIQHAGAFDDFSIIHIAKRTLGDTGRFFLLYAHGLHFRHVFGLFREYGFPKQQRTVYIFDALTGEYICSGITQIINALRHLGDIYAQDYNKRYSWDSFS